MSIKDLFEILKGICELISIYFIFRLYLLSAKNPFKSHIIGDLSNYFKNVPVNSSIIEDNCFCDNITFNRSCSEEDIIKGCKNISSSSNVSNKSFTQRKLVSSSFCQDMQESFVRNKNKKLTYIFNLNYGTIRKISLPIPIIFLCWGIIGGIFEANAFSIKEHSNIIFYILEAVIFLLWCAKTTLTIILFYKIDDGDIEKYDNFLECKNVKEKFFEKFTDINKFRKYFKIFAILSIVVEAIDKLTEIIEEIIEINKKNKDFKDFKNSIKDNKKDDEIDITKDDNKDMKNDDNKDKNKDDNQTMVKMINN